MNELGGTNEKLDLSDRVRILHDSAKNLYNNFIRSIEIGNIMMVESILDHNLRAGVDRAENIPEDDLDLKEQCRRFHDELTKEVQKVGLAQAESDRFAKLRWDSSEATEDDYLFLQDFLIKIDRIFNAMMARGWSEEDLRG